MKWTDNHIAMLQQAITNNQDLAKLAARWGTTREAMWVQKCKLKITPDTRLTGRPERQRAGRRDPELEAKACGLIKQGLPARAAAEALNVSPTHIENIAKRNGLTMSKAERHSSWGARRQEELRKLVANGYTATQIAIKLGDTSKGCVDQAKLRFRLQTKSVKPSERYADGKFCGSCNTLKPLSDFSASHRPGQKISSCRSCRNDSSVLWRHGARAIPGDRCDACDAPAETVDHCHAPGEQRNEKHDRAKVRGLLCFPCNTALGQFRDSTVVLGRVRAYLSCNHTGLFVPTGWTSVRWLEESETAAAASRLGIYGLTPEQFAELLRGQSNRCGLCQVAFGIDRDNSPHVDHDHSTREIRGLLCTGCNKGLGALTDSPERAEVLVDYLAHPPGAPVRPVTGRTPGLEQLFDELLAKTGELFVPRLVPYGLSARVAKDVLVVLLDPKVHNSRELEARQEISERGSARLVLSRWLMEQRDNYRRVILATPDRLREALTHTVCYALGLSRCTVYARDTTVGAVDAKLSSEFLGRYHFQGAATKATVRLGLFVKQELVALMTFDTAESVRSSGGALLQRFCTSYSVPGGASKLLAAYRALHPGPVVSFSDDGYAVGGLYQTLGFQAGVDPAPTYCYWRDGVKYPKAYCQQPKLLKEAMEAGLETLSARPTETELARRLGYQRVYLPGRRKWTLA